ncbi:MAG: ABC transporter ATP-binding protein, partial [Clostridia bacterium]|nr:ABC transporter ATP-binding protein [Clostridia bacterium]
MIFGILSSICSIIGPNKLADLTDTITAGLFTGIDFSKVVSIATFILGLYITSAILSFFTSFIMATTANRLAKNLRTSISKKINRLPLKYFDKHSFGDILSRVTNDVDTIGMSISHNLGSFISAIALLIS